MTTNETHEGCLMCTVRALTEGTPDDWAADPANREAGATVTGVVLRKGEEPNPFSTAPVKFLDLWLGGNERVRVRAYSDSLAGEIARAEIQVGDTVTVLFEGTRMIESGRRAGWDFKVFQVTVERGHHRCLL